MTIKKTAVHFPSSPVRNMLPENDGAVRVCPTTIATRGLLGFDQKADWLQPYASDNKGDTPHTLLATAFYAHSVQILADSARVLGKSVDADKYGDEAAVAKQGFADHFFDVDGKLQNAPETQTAYILTLAFDLIPAKLQASSVTHLLRLIGDADGHLRTGFLGTPFITQVLDQSGHSKVAFSVLFKETYPSWFFSINQGATTMWERWNSYSHEDGFGDVAMNSFNHYAYGAVGQWACSTIGGTGSQRLAAQLVGRRTSVYAVPARPLNCFSPVFRQVAL